LVWIMLNPSTADAVSDDPTIRRCVSFARRWGYGGIDVYNLFALRSPSPRALETADDPVGPANDAWLDKTLKAGGPIIGAWGSCQTALQRNRAARVREILLNGSLDRILCLGLTATGQPKHPLYARNDTVLEPWLNRTDLSRILGADPAASQFASISSQIQVVEI
jgi:hypothetical protein